MVASTEIDTRLFGMVIALWRSGSPSGSGGDFLTARNLEPLRPEHLDRGHGDGDGPHHRPRGRIAARSPGYAMALVQTDGVFAFFGLDVTAHSLPNKTYIWQTLAFGMLLGALGAVQGFIVAYVGVPSFEPRRLPRLARRRMGGNRGRRCPRSIPARPRRRGVTRRVAKSVAGAPRLRRDRSERRSRPTATPALRPSGCDISLIVAGCVAVVAGVGLAANRYKSPITGDPTGVAYRVVILIGVTLVMTYLARAGGRYVRLRRGSGGR